MNGFEKEKLQDRVQGMTMEEQILAAKALPYEVLWGELHRRFVDMYETINDISQRIQREGSGVAAGYAEE